MGTVIKNNCKLLFRNKVMIAVVILGTLAVIAALSNAFHMLLDRTEEAGSFTLGYRMAQESGFSSYEEVLIENLKGKGIVCAAYPNEEPEELVKNGSVDVFLDITGDGYHIFGGRDHELQVRSIQYMMNRAYPGEEKISLTAEELPYIKTAEAENYYGIIEIIYFISICSVFLEPILASERKNRLGKRFGMGNVNSVQLYLGKLIPCVLESVLVQIVVAGGLATFLFQIEWGSPAAAFGILCLGALAFAALGLVFMLASSSLAVAIVLQFMLMWACGFVGGTFETYMYSSVPEAIKRLSPIYYVNRTLVEISTMGESAYTIPCLIYLTAIIAVCVSVGILLVKLKKENG